MAETAASRLNRITTVLAELWQDRNSGPVDLADLATRHRTTKREILRDIEVVSEAADNPMGELGMTSFSIVKGGVVAHTLGPFRRPLRLNRHESLALRVCLATEPEVGETLRSLSSADHDADPAIDIGASCGSDAELVARLALVARSRNLCLEIQYTGAGATEEVRRVIHPYEVVEHGGVAYINAWCEQADERRVFRTERVLEARILDRQFDRRDDVERVERPEDLDDRSEDSEPVTVRFSPRVAPWIRERYADAARQADGTVLVDFKVWDAGWLVGHVLQYGPDAEVVAPESYREVMRGAVGLST